DEHAVDGYDSEAHTPKASPINRALAEEGKRRTPKAKGTKAAPRSTVRTAAKAAAPAATLAANASTRSTVARGAPMRGGYVKPMLATLADAPFDDPDWIFEIKWDGYRAIAETGGKDLRLYSRNGRAFKQAYPAVEADLERVERELVLDG